MKTPAQSLLIRKILKHIADGSLNAATSTLTWDEVVWSVRKLIGTETAIKHGKHFLDFPNLRLLRVDSGILSTAQKIIEKYNLKPRDAIHLACCLENDIDEIISDDSDFDHFKETKRIPLDKV